MKSRSTTARPLRSEIARAFATFRSDPALLRMKLRQRWDNRREQPPAGPPGNAVQRPRVASIDHDLDTILSDLRRRGVRTGAIYGDAGFRQTLAEGASEVTWSWLSHRDTDILAGATRPSPDAIAESDVVVVGGADVKTAYINTLRLLDRGGSVKPVLWVGQNFEFCGSTIPIPAQVESADIYLFHHFADFFPVKDPLLVRVSAKDRRHSDERLVLIRPQQTVRFSLDELLPERDGTAVVEVLTTHPALTGNRHPRWRVWADLFWRDSLTSLHGAHDYGPDHLCEARIPLSECVSGSVVVTLPNYDHHLGNGDGALRLATGGEKRSVERDGTLPIEQIDVRRDADADEKAPFLGYRYQGHGTSYWFAFEESRDGRPSLHGNHEVTVAQVEHRPPLGPEQLHFLEEMERHKYLFWPHALPILDEKSELEFGFSFEWANPQVFDFRLVGFDGDGRSVGRADVALRSRGYHWSDEIAAAFASSGSQRPALVLVSPDWRKMKVDPQQINAFGNLAIRNRVTGDRDITEFQSCWRNLGATIEGFPHWLHPSKGVVGRTNVVGHVRCARGLRTGILVVNGAGNLEHSARATVKVQLHSPSGAARVGEVELAPFTSRLLWVDEMFDGMQQFLGDGYGTALVTCADADVNCQILTCSTTGSVSLQHLWGY